MSAREEILRYLKRHPGATVREIAEALGMTQANIRHHMALLEAEGRVTGRVEEARTRRGRPSRRYFLTEKALPTYLEPLTRALLLAFRESGLPLERLCAHFCPCTPQGGTLWERLNAATQFFQERAYMPRWEAHKDGPRVLFAQCPYGSLTREFPELCELDRIALARLLGHEVQAVQVGPAQPMCIFAVQPTPGAQA